jgi:hypothetical protein
VFSARDVETQRHGEPAERRTVSSSSVFLLAVVNVLAVMVISLAVMVIILALWSMDWLIRRFHRHTNMDYGLFSTAHDVETPTCVAYDVGCQWIRNLHLLRVPQLPKHIQPKYLSKENLTVIVGAMHIHGHTSSCQGPFAGEYRPGNGRTFGDGIEHGWADLNSLAPSASRMSPGSRADLIDDGCAWWNLAKEANFCTSGCDRLQTATLTK